MLDQYKWDYDNPFQNVHDNDFIQLVVESKKPWIYLEQTTCTSIVQSCWVYSSTQSSMFQIQKALQSVAITLTTIN